MKSNHASIRKNTSYKDKRLTFFDGENDSDDSNSMSLMQSTSSKRERNEKKPNSNNNNGFPEESSHHKKAVSCSPRAEDGSKEEDTKSDNEVASSTSSCSCEDHSSVAGRSEDLHEDLDYDEDSIKGSPCSNRLEPLLDSSQKSINLTDDTSPEENTASENRASQDETIASHSGDNTPPERLASRSPDHSQETNHSRIKSVINFNHINDDVHEPNNSEAGEKDKSYKSYECLLKYFFKDACYFQIKSINRENVELSKSMGVWSTPVQNEIRLNSAFREHRNVILIFSVQQSGGFQGFARMTSESRETSCPIPWVLPARLSNKSLGGVFTVEWLCTKELPFHRTHDLYNPFNNDKPVKVARDGQQVEPKVGKKLCRLFPRDSKRRLLACLATLKQQTRQRRKSTTRYDNYFPRYIMGGPNDNRHPHDIIPLPEIDGLRVPGIASQINNDYINLDAKIHYYRSSHGRRRAHDQANTSVYHRQNQFSSHHGLMRPHYMPRNIDDMTRCLIPNSHVDYQLNQPYPPQPNCQYPDTYIEWGPHPDMNRYHPYQRSRR